MSIPTPTTPNFFFGDPCLGLPHTTGRCRKFKEISGKFPGKKVPSRGNILREKRSLVEETLVNAKEVCQDSIRSEFLHTALHNTEIVPCNQQTQHPWLLTAHPPTVQTPCTDSIAFPNASLAVTSSSDATFMLPAPSDHHMRETTTALLSVSATLGPQLVMVVQVLRALSGPARRNA